MAPHSPDSFSIFPWCVCTGDHILEEEFRLQDISKRAGLLPQTRPVDRETTGSLSGRSREKTQ